MRKGRRDTLVGKFLLLLTFTLVGAPAAAARQEPQANPAGSPLVRLTLEVRWSGRERPGEPASPPTGATTANPGSPVELEILEGQGQVVEAISWPQGVALPRPREGAWRLGGDQTGRVRVRVEAALTSTLAFRCGGQVMNLPLAAVLEGTPPRTPAQFPVDLVVERLPWDVLSVSVGAAQAEPPPQPSPMGDAAPPPPPAPTESDGLVAPGSTVPVTVGVNILTPEPAEVSVRCQVEVRPLRGSEPPRRQEVREVVATDSAQPPAFVIPVEMPKEEGTYVLDVRASWEPVAGHESGSLLGRIIRRGRRAVQPGAAVGSGSAQRRVTLTVLGDGADPSVAHSVARDREVDSLDLARMRNNRPSAAGRAPAPAAGRAAWPVPSGAIVEASRRDRLQGWFSRAGAEVSELGPADAKGLAWSAVGLKVAHPGRPHRLTLSVAGGHPVSLGVAVVGPAVAESGTTSSARPRLLLDACASGPPILPEGPAATFSWLVWPDTADPVLVLVNRSDASPVRLGTATLTELSQVPAPPEVEEPSGTPTRGIGVALTGPGVLERFAAGVATEPGLADVLTAARNLGRYVDYCGASSVLLSERMGDRGRRRALDGQAGEDSAGPDRFRLTARALKRQGMNVWLELGLEGALPGLPAAGSPEALARGLVRLDRRGMADGPTPAYNPLHPEVAEALKARILAALSAYKDCGNLSGVVVRLGPGATLPGGPDTGFDDATFARFVRDSFEGDALKGLPGLDSAGPERYEARARFLAGSGRMPWLAWRSKRVAELYATLAAAARQTSPGVELAVVTPGLGDDPAGAEARRTDLAGLAPSLAWRAVGLDLDAWPADSTAPVVFRGVGLGPDDLAHDLATNPELDAKVAARPARGLLVGGGTAGQNGSEPGPLALSALPLDAGSAGDEPLGHALAALDARWVMLAAEPLAGHEEQLRRFARVFRGLPAPAAHRASPTEGAEPAPFGVAARVQKAGGQTYLSLANDSPFPVRLETVVAAPASATFDDLGRAARLKPDANASGHHVVLDLLPFGVAGVRVSSADAKLGAVTPYPSEAVLTSLQARYDELSELLSRLGRKTAGPSGPANPGFELAGPGVSGWQTGGGMGNTLSVDPSKPRSGRGSLRIDAATPPASATSAPFPLGVQSSLLVRAWLRSDHPDARVRLWIEGESAGKPYKRVSEMLAQPAWAERAVRAGDLPASGLDTARLRFELLGPGVLWVDDLSVSGPELSDPERRNARNALLAAIQAYREKRYADFARLAGSHWARLPGASQGSVASALPQGRRLR